MVSHHSHRQLKKACVKEVDYVKSASLDAWGKGLRVTGDAQKDRFLAVYEIARNAGFPTVHGSGVASHSSTPPERRIPFFFGSDRQWS
jgi:hypothetical protein